MAIFAVSIVNVKRGRACRACRACKRVHYYTRKRKNGKRKINFQKRFSAEGLHSKKRRFHCKRREAKEKKCRNTEKQKAY